MIPHLAQSRTVDMSYLATLSACLISYLMWAIVLSDNLFHRVWSLALCSLFGLASVSYLLPASLNNVPLYFLTIFDSLLCIALSPFPAILSSENSTFEEPERLAVIFPHANDSQDDLLAEFAFLSLRLGACG